MRLQQQGVAVYVTEGVVGVFKPPVPGQPQPSQAAATTLADNRAATDLAVKVSAGQQATYGEPATPVVAVASPANLPDKLSWQQGKLVFKGEPLGQVIEEFSRYTPIKIIIPGKKMRQLKVGGIFKIGDTAAMLDALQSSFGISAEYVDDNIVYLVFNEDK